MLDQQTDADHRRSEVWTEPVFFSSQLGDDIHLSVFKSQSLLGESARQQGETWETVNIHQHSHMSNSLG